MAIFPAKYNGINFSYDFTRESNLFNFDNQRKKNVLPLADFKCISFFVKDVVDEASALLKIIYIFEGLEIVSPLATVELETIDNQWIFYFGNFETFLGENTDVYFSFECDGDVVYSEIYTIKSTVYFLQNEICKISAYNNDNRHGYLTNAYPAFGFFKFSKLNSDIFINKKTEYEYSYGRRKILSSENNIGKRFTFLDLTMYQQNLLKWLCNSENLFIDGIRYELISDFTELLADENSEVKDLRADFVEAEQSFFAIGSQTAPTNVFAGEIFMK